MTRTTAYTFTVVALVSTICSGCSTVSPGNAAGYGGPAPQMMVSYSDLDISHSADAETPLSRLHFAANAVCGGRPDDQRDLNTWGHYRACDKQAMDHAVATVNSPLVAQLYSVPGQNTDDALSRIVNNISRNISRVFNNN